MIVFQVISGVTQDESKWNGSLTLREKLLAHLDDYSPLAVRVRYDQWNANWKHVARQMHLLRDRYEPKGEPFSVVVFAYSWGVGNGLVKLAKELKRYGIGIECAVICDGIYRHWFGLGNWRIVCGWPITIPTNVRSLIAYHQSQARPYGVKPIVDGKLTQFNEETDWIELIRPHIDMDDASAYHAECLRVADHHARRATRGTCSVPVGAFRTAAVESRVAGGVA